MPCQSSSRRGTGQGRLGSLSRPESVARRFFQYHEVRQEAERVLRSGPDVRLPHTQVKLRSHQEPSTPNPGGTHRLYKVLQEILAVS